MRKTKTIYATLALAAFAAALIAPAPLLAEEAPGFEPLFNGKDLSGWHGESTIDPRKFHAMSPEEQKAKLETDAADAAQHWSVADDEIVNDGHGVFLATDKEYGDVELFIDFKIGPLGDSGIYLRGTPQIQIWDFREEGGKHELGADKGSGGLWNNSPGAPGKDPLVFADNPIGEWNTLRVIQIGARTTIYLNGKLVVHDAIMENFWDRNSPLAAVGPIQLQTHGSETRFRNIKAREIPAAEANAYLARIGDGGGFTELFNGKDLSGWQGPVENYEVVDGAIRCKPGLGGTIYYGKEYGDFIARVEFKLPPGGNNGLAIRYPGEGNAAYDGMTELQVLDDDDEQYATLDARQYHGSAYGQVAAHRGYLRPVGQWNYEVVTVKGPKIQVELNGSVILDADLSTVTEFMANSPHPGKDLTKGYFGFAGHNEPVEFRNISLKPLD